MGRTCTSSLVVITVVNVQYLMDGKSKDFGESGGPTSGTSEEESEFTRADRGRKRREWTGNRYYEHQISMGTVGHATRTENATWGSHQVGALGEVPLLMEP